MSERRKILEQSTIKEGMITADQELSKLKDTTVPASIVNAKNTTLELQQYCIKGSYNTALTGNYINTEMIKYVLFRGCRFMDFEIFSIGDAPYVAYSTDSTYATINTQNKETLQNVLSTISNHAFSTPSPNPQDPIFLNLRIKTNNTKLYDQIAQAIGSTLTQQLYVDESAGYAKPVHGTTLLSNLMGKVIIVVDRSYAPTYKSVSNLGQYVNMESSSETMYSYGYGLLMQQQYNTPFIKTDGITTNIQTLKLVYPDTAYGIVGWSSNPIYYPVVLNYGIQVMLYPFYVVDMYLGQYETAFATNKSAFVPVSKMITYLQGSLGLSKSAASPTETTI